MVYVPRTIFLCKFWQYKIAFKKVVPKYLLSKKKGKNVSTGHMDAPSYGKKKKKQGLK
jgi:hypothetical protein